MEVTTEFIAGANRRVLTLEGYDIFGTELYYENWIEGIGSSNGLIPFGYNYDYWSKMTCFSESKTVQRKWKVSLFRLKALHVEKCIQYNKIAGFFYEK